MNSLNYIGSKKTLFNTILNICNDNIDNLSTKHFADLFSGTGIMSYNFSTYFASISANDMEYYSYIIINALIKCNYTDKLQNIIDNLNKLNINDLNDKNNLIYTNFSPHENCERMFFTIENAKKCDICRYNIEQLFQNNQINQNEYYYLIASLLVSIDKVANTSSVYGAYLKQFKKSALKPLIIIPIHKKTTLNITNNKCYNQDINELIKQHTFDIVYLDPPYNGRQYSSNYSPLNYIALYDSTINLTGKTGLIQNYNKSNFCSKVKVKKSFEDLFNNLNCNYILLSYNNEGLLNCNELTELLLQKGDVKLYKIKYKKFKAQQAVDIDNVYEYLFYINCLEKNNNFKEIIYELVN